MSTTPTNGNGGGKILWWLIGGILTPLLLSSINTVIGDSKRVAGLEAIIQEVDRRLERVENKIEKLLERKP
jgi:hypothetical protein